MLRLRTARLLLRPLIAADADAIVALLAEDRAAVDQTAAIRWPVTRMDTLEWIDSPAAPGELRLCIADGATGALAGCIGGRILGDTARLGYWMGRDFRRRGYATEAMNGLIAEAHEQGCCVIRADVFQGNLASTGVLEKLHFRQLAAGWRHVRHFALELPAQL